MFHVLQDNKNIFQICIGLNDNIDSLKEAKKRLLELNPSYQYHYITSEEMLDSVMIENFKNSEDNFERKIYECYDSIASVLAEGQKMRRCREEHEKKEVRRICVLVSKTDVFRLAALYRYGGIYIDLTKSFKLDIDKAFSYRDVVLIRSYYEIHSSMVYAKKHNPVIKKILEWSIEICKNYPRKVNQMWLAGPGAYTNVVRKEWSAFEFDDSESFKLSPYNGVILLNCVARSMTKGYRYLNFSAPWRKEVHHTDPNDPDKQINTHWLLDY